MERMEELDELRIIRSVLQGNANAYGPLVKRYERPIYNLMVRTLGRYTPPEEARDLTQDAFVRAYEKLDSFKEGSKFFPWLYAISLNLAKDYLRKKRIRTFSSDALTDCDPALSDSMACENEIFLRLETGKALEALQLLPLDYSEAIILRYQEELSMKEVAQALGVSVSGAKMRVHRGLAKLRDIMCPE